MKDDVKKMYESVTMPKHTEESIRAAMAEHSRKKETKKISWRTAVSFAAMLVLVLLLSPTARAAVEDWVVKYFFPGSDITIYEKTDENGEVVAIAGVDTEAPAFARMVNGRLYFLGNGEKIDITDQIAEDAPYFYEYVDDYGLTHLMAVGYSGTPENFGIYEFIKDGQTGEWVTGTGRNFIDPETETRYPWVDLIWEHWNIPWPMPEK